MAKKNSSNQDADVLIVTPEGYAAMQAEREERLIKAQEIATRINDARQRGDLKENTEYHEEMQAKEFNDARIDELEYNLSIAQIVENQSKTVIGIGSTIEIERQDATKEKQTVTLVGKQASQESDPIIGKVSIDSPIGKALNGQSVGAQVTVELPRGPVAYKILKLV